MNCVICRKPAVTLWDNQCATCLENKRQHPIGVAIGGETITAGSLVFNTVVDTLSELRSDKKKAEQEINKILNDLQKKHKDVKFELCFSGVCMMSGSYDKPLELELTLHM